MAMVGLFLADNDHIRMIFQFGQRLDGAFGGVTGELEDGMQDESLTSQPWINQDGERAGQFARGALGGE